MMRVFSNITRTGAKPNTTREIVIQGWWRGRWTEATAANGAIENGRRGPARPARGSSQGTGQFMFWDVSSARNAGSPEGLPDRPGETL